MNASALPNELKDAWDQRLVALGDDAKAIEGSMQAAQAVVRNHAERLNAMNRIVCLPSEILEPIFWAVQAADPFTGRLHHSWSAEAEWILISHVCRRWRQVAIGFSDLWTDVDVDWYGIPFCKEMLSRLGSREFSLRATLKKHQDFLFETSLRQRIPIQLYGLTLNFDDTVTQPGAFLDTLLSYVTGHSSPVLRELQITCRNPEDMYWASLTRVLPSLTSMQFTYLYLGGSIPTLLPTLTELTFTSVDLTSNGPDAAGILDLIPALPALESLTFNNCSFSPLDAPKAVLPQCMELVHFEASHEWSLQQCRALSRMLTQTTGDRVFVISHANPNIAEELFAEVKDAVNSGLDVYEVSVEFTGWASLDASIKFECDASDSDSDDSERGPQPLCIQFNKMTPACWSAFCSSLDGVDMRDASLRFTCDQGTPYMFVQNNLNIMRDLRQLTVSAIHLTGRVSSYPALNLFNAMREPLGNTLSFPALKDVSIEHSPLATKGVTDLDLASAESVSNQLDEAALYLVWYARARREHDLKPLRTVALPNDLLQKHWAIELNDLLEGRVLSYDEFIKAEDETNTTDCRAVVLYRPVLRALRFWETWILTFAPVIGVLGILWTSSRRK